MQNVAERTPLRVASSTITSGIGNGSRDSDLLSRFCQLQVEQIASQTSIVWAQIVYYDPFLQSHQEVASKAEELDFKTRDALRKKVDSTDFPPVFTLTELPLTFSLWKGYFCPIGYRNYQPEYLLVIANSSPSPGFQDYLISCANLVSQHCELYSHLYHQSSENQLLEQIFHRVGHQLRNPLSLISLYAENLRRELSNHPSQAQAVVIRDTVQNLLANLNDLIYCGKSSQLRIALHDIQALITEAIHELKPWIEEKQLNILYSSVPVTLIVDHVQIKQVFINLLNNAIHFSPKSGTIHVNWQVFQREVLIQITDQGRGLSDNDLKKLFVPFYSQRPGGTGLGLTIAQKIILDHHGSLWAQNSPEGGAQFSFTLLRQ
ncbi:MAG: HAMP domain-containing histidine kinase [Cyanobacteria bacterium RM1_2_2]|nr:HAMP domain-containing histidine kinase [Cyanobacteria bacterium RM1_2_2]